MIYKLWFKDESIQVEPQAPRFKRGAEEGKFTRIVPLAPKARLSLDVSEDIQKRHSLTVYV